MRLAIEAPFPFEDFEAALEKTLSPEYLRLVDESVHWRASVAAVVVAVGAIRYQSPRTCKQNRDSPARNGIYASDPLMVIVGTLESAEVVL